jgi:hypothetical protein
MTRTLVLLAAIVFGGCSAASGEPDLVEKYLRAYGLSKRGFTATEACRDAIRWLGADYWNVLKEPLSAEQIESLCREYDPSFLPPDAEHAPAGPEGQ